MKKSASWLLCEEYARMGTSKLESRTSSQEATEKLGKRRWRLVHGQQQLAWMELLGISSLPKRQQSVPLHMPMHSSCSFSLDKTSYCSPSSKICSLAHVEHPNPRYHSMGMPALWPSFSANIPSTFLTLTGSPILPFIVADLCMWTWSHSHHYPMILPTFLKTVSLLSVIPFCRTSHCLSSCCHSNTYLTVC